MLQYRILFVINFIRIVLKNSYQTILHVSASVYAISSPLGSLLGGIAMDLWGRRCMNMIGNIGMAIGWILIAFAQNPAMLIYGRIAEGLSRSFLATCIMVIIQIIFKKTLYKPLAFKARSISMTRPLNYV